MLRFFNKEQLVSFLLLCVCAVCVVTAWYLPARPVDPQGGGAGEKFASLSFSAYRPWESPLTDHFPTVAEADADMAVVAREASAIRTYSAVEGDLDIAALAQKHGVKLWQGIWLGSDRAHNEIEMSRGVAFANKYPDTVTRVVVGNEVLLRRDLPPAELMADIDRVKRAVKQPVAYADVWNFWLQFPQVASHVDIMLIHLLPYWEDVPTGIDRAVPYIGQVFDRMRAAFRGKQIAIGETGWPSRGRARADAVPSLVNETIFLREFLRLAQAKHFDYNFIEAFDQVWKYRSEGIVGASWGIFDAARRTKIPLSGGLAGPRGGIYWHRTVAVCHWPVARRLIAARAPRFHGGGGNGARGGAGVRRGCRVADDVRCSSGNRGRGECAGPGSAGGAGDAAPDRRAAGVPRAEWYDSNACRARLSHTSASA